MSEPQQPVNYRKLGGWLKFFYIFNLITLPVFLLSQAFVSLAEYMGKTVIPLPPAGVIDQIITITVASVFSIVIVILIHKRNRRAIDVFTANKLVMAAFVVCRFLFLSSGATPLISGVLTQIGQLAAWNIYFKRSERVSVYFK